jgi:hypothetical protein
MLGHIKSRFRWSGADHKSASARFNPNTVEVVLLDISVARCGGRAFLFDDTSQGSNAEATLPLRWL